MRSTSKGKRRLELWRTTYSWLKACGNNINIIFCREEITTHPDYPSLLSVTDFLEIGGLPYKAIRKDRSYITEFKYPLLAHIKQPGDEYMYLVSEVRDWDIHAEVTRHWSGVVLFQEENAKWHNEQNTAYDRNDLKNKITASAFAFAGIVLYIISDFQLFAMQTSLGQRLLIGLFGIVSFTGVVISLVALGIELGVQTQIAKQVCGAISGGGCDIIFRSPLAKGISGITPADASVIYFTTQFFIYLLGCWFPPFLQGTFVFALGGAAIAALSVVTQASLLKRWCGVCLAIVTVLVFQNTIALFVTKWPSQRILPELIFMGTFIFLLMSLLPVKHLVKLNRINRVKLVEYKKWKMDGKLFITQWKEEPEVDKTIWPNDLILGNPYAPIQVTVACNLYCRPCAHTHEQLNRLLHRFSDKISVQLRLSSSSGADDSIHDPAVDAILERAQFVQNNEELKSMLSDWFRWMNLDKWRIKWGPISLGKETKASRDRIILHRKWIEQSRVVSTPTIFVNGKKIPSRYSVDDLGILLPQLADLTRI